MCQSRMYSHSTLIASFCPVFARAQMLYKEGVLNEPYRISVIFTEEVDHVRNERDTETVYDRMKWFINTLREPDCGLVVSIYQNLDGRNWITDPWFLNHIWPFKKQWEPKGKYITIHNPNDNIGGRKAERLLAEAPIYSAKAEEMAKRFGYEVYYLSYAMPWNDAYELLLGTDHHFTYVGASYYLAALTNTPTTAWAYRNPKKRQITSSYPDYNTGKVIPIIIPETRWGSVGLSRGRTLQYDPELNDLINHPQTYIREIHNVKQVEDVFAGMWKK